MADLPLFTHEGKSAGTVAVDEKVFGDKVLKKLLHQVVVAYESNRRQGNAHTKTRAEVSYSVKKPWPQKHTGMARAGMKKSPIWRHGGITFGPRTRDHRRGMTVSMRRAALDSALLGKILDGEVAVIESLKIETPKTSQLARILKAAKLDGSLLIGVKDHDKNTWLSARNLEGVSMLPVGGLNAYDVLRNRRLLLTRDALSVLTSSRQPRKKAEK